MGTEHDPLTAAREIMKQQAREAGQPITERWHNHSSRDACQPTRCPAGGTDWDGRGLVSDHFTNAEGAASDRPSVKAGPKSCTDEGSIL